VPSDITGHHGGERPAALASVRRWAGRHETVLWWLHSLYVLGLGTGVMWLGSRNAAWLRFAAWYLLVIWLSSVFLAEVVHPRAGLWWTRARFLVNYLNKNLYQQLLFFILPIYAASATAWSRNVVFVALVAVSALLSTLDVVYDRFLSVHRGVAAFFFAFNVFAVVAVALPLLAGFSNQNALRLATLASAAGFVTIAWRPAKLRRRSAVVGIGAGVVLVLGAGELIRPLVPPAPLRLDGTEFGAGLDRRAIRVTGPLSSVASGFEGRLFATTALHAPLGLTDKVELRWYRGDRQFWSSAAHEFVGGRRDGFRLWSAVAIGPGPDAITLDVVTAAGQLVGRARLLVRD
jgi:hypothetical protein